MKYKKDKTQFILTGYLIINVLYLLIASCLWCHYKIYFETYSHGFICLLITNIITIIYLIIKKRYKKNIIDLYLMLSIIFSCISTIFAYNKEVSLFGMYNRYEGLLQICYYMTILFISSNIDEKNKKYIIYTILFTGVIEFLYGFLQVLNLDFIEVQGLGVTLARGMITNSNFYGTYMLICLSYAIGMFYDEEKSDRRIIGFILIFLFIIGLLISNALSSVVGFICVLIYCLIYSIINKKCIKFIVILLTFIFTLKGLTVGNLTFCMDDLIKTKNEIKEISKGNFDDHFGTDRLYVWKKTIEILPDNILNGVGIDNFYYAFDGKPLTIYEGLICYDKVHNEYLQTLITEGIFALIVYLLLYVTIVFKTIKNSFIKKQLYLILPIGGYLIQAFFNISVIEVAPLFYIGLGLAIERKNINN